jgi:hypothetical protein
MDRPNGPSQLRSQGRNRPEPHPSLSLVPISRPRPHLPSFLASAMPPPPPPRATVPANTGPISNCYIPRKLRLGLMHGIPTRAGFAVPPPSATPRLTLALGFDSVTVRGGGGAVDEGSRGVLREPIDLLAAAAGPRGGGSPVMEDDLAP